MRWNKNYPATRSPRSLRSIKTTFNRKMTKEVNSFAKGANESRIAGAPQSQKKENINQKTIKPAQSVSIAEHKTNNNPTSKDRRI